MQHVAIRASSNGPSKETLEKTRDACTLREMPSTMPERSFEQSRGSHSLESEAVVGTNSGVA